MNTKGKFVRIKHSLLWPIALALLSACNAGSFGSGADSGSYGSIAVQVTWPGAGGLSAPASGLIGPSGGRIVPETLPGCPGACVVNSVRAQVTNPSGTVVASKTFANAPTAFPTGGTVDNVPAGGPYDVTITGYASTDGTGSPNYVGASAPVTSVTAGTTASAGTITMAAAGAGTADPSFNPPKGLNAFPGTTFGFGKALALDSTGRIYVAGAVGGNLCAGNGSGFAAIWRFNADGTTDSSFGTSGLFIDNSTGSTTGAAFGVAVDPNDLPVAAGLSHPTTAGGSPCTTALTCMTVWRFTKAGALDTTFGSLGTGRVFATGDTGSVQSKANAVIVSGTGKIYVTGQDLTTTNMDLWKFDSTGAPDTSLTGFKAVTSLAATGAPSVGNRMAFDGVTKIVIVGKSLSGPTLWRFTDGGNFDSFTSPGTQWINVANTNSNWNALAVSGGNYYIAGSSICGGTNMSIWSYLSTTGAAASFGGGPNGTRDGLANTTANGIAIDTNGKVVIAGTDTLSLTKMAVWRYVASTQLRDTTTFNTAGTLGYFEQNGASGGGTADQGTGMVIDPSNRILVTGTSGVDGVLWRFFNQ